jgi:hypothetical protein
MFEGFPLEKGWALRSSHKYGQHGSGKCIRGMPEIC